MADLDNVLQPWNAIVATLEISSGGLGVPSLVPVAKIKRRFDNKYWDGVAWVVGVSTVNMAELDPAEFAGFYVYTMPGPSLEYDKSFPGYAVLITEPNYTKRRPYLITPQRRSDWDEAKGDHQATNSLGAILQDMISLRQENMVIEYTGYGVDGKVKDGVVYLYRSAALLNADGPLGPWTGAYQSYTFTTNYDGQLRPTLYKSVKN